MVFYINIEGRTYPVKAGGVIFKYNDLYLLQQNTDEKYTGNPKKFYSWSDFGGKVEKEDTNILETIIRELKEETNDILTNINFDNSIYYYISNAKYLLIINTIDNKIDEKLFGNKEIKTNRMRRCEWKNIFKVNLHPRLINFSKKIIINYKNIIY